MPERLEQLKQWLSHDLGLPAFEIEPASVDASFRRYFRIRFDGESRIVMDAPPHKENCRPFVEIGQKLFAIGLNVPEILAEDLGQGLLLLGDLGDRSYLQALDESSVERLYGDAQGALLTLQACMSGEEAAFPHFSGEKLRQEMGLFSDWFLTRHLGLELSESDHAMLEAVFNLLAEVALSQPQVFVHRDYHSRNLMVCEHNPGILDFQDALIGPVTYDLVSLLRDAYIDWPRARVEEWALGYHDLALHSGVLQVADEERFLRDFDLMGAQRQLKVVGIFARLNYRDAKPDYLLDIPRVLGYLRETAGRYQELAPLSVFLEQRVIPAME